MEIPFNSPKKRTLEERFISDSNEPVNYDLEKRLNSFPHASYPTAKLDALEHFPSSEVVEADIAIEIVYSKEERDEHMAGLTSRNAGKYWDTLRTTISRDLQGGGLTSPPRSSYRMLNNGHVAAFWVDANAQLVRMLYQRLVNDDTKERLLKLHVIGVNLIENCKIVARDIHFQSYFSHEAKRSIYRFNINVGNVPKAPRALLNPIASHHTEEKFDQNLAQSVPSLGMRSSTVEPSIPAKRGRSMSGDYRDLKRPAVRLSPDSTSSRDTLDSKVKQEHELCSVTEVEKALRLAQAQLDDYHGINAITHFEKNPSSVLRTLQQVCKDKVASLTVLLERSKEKDKQDREMTEKDVLLADMNERVARVERSAAEERDSLKQEISFHRSTYLACAKELEGFRQEKAKTSPLRDLDERRIKEAAQEAENRVRQDVETKISLEAELRMERDRRIEAEKTLRNVLTVIHEMDDILEGRTEINLPKAFREKIRASNSQSLVPSCDFEMASAQLDQLAIPH